MATSLISIVSNPIKVVVVVAVIIIVVVVIVVVVVFVLNQTSTESSIHTTHYHSKIFFTGDP